jgi:hypothetical protein
MENIFDQKMINLMRKKAEDKTDYAACLKIQ